MHWDLFYDSYAPPPWAQGTINLPLPSWSWPPHLSPQSPSDTIAIETVTSSLTDSEHFLISHFTFASWMLMAHSNPLTFCVIHKYPFDSSSLVYICPPTQLLFLIMKVIWILSPPFVILNILASVAVILMIKLHLLFSWLLLKISSYRFSEIMPQNLTDDVSVYINVKEYW